MKKLDKLISTEKLNLHETGTDLDVNERITNSLEILSSSKNVSKHLTAEFRKSDTSIFRKLKNFVLGKIANVVRNVMDKPLITQQTFNRQTYHLIAHLIKENKKLSDRITEIEKRQS